MPRARLPLVVVFLVAWQWAPSLAQTTTDLSTLRFTHAFELERERMLLGYRDGAVFEFLNTAREIVTMSDDAGGQRTALLGEIQYLSDSIETLDQYIDEAAPTARQARGNLIRALEAQAAREPVGQRRQALQAEIEELRSSEAPVTTATLFASEAATLGALARIVADERADLRTLSRLQDELRLFLGNLRLFDETGMPPSARSDAGSGTDPGSGCGACEIPTSPTAASPGDLPMEHFRSGAAGEDRLGGTTPIDLASLNRLGEQLASHRGVSESYAEVADHGDDGIVTRDLNIEASLLTFRDEGGGNTGYRLKAGSSFLLPLDLGRGLQLTFEPRLGGRSVQLEPGSSTEIVGEVWENLLGSAGDGRVRWQVVSWQKGRYLSEPLPLPAYLEPGRLEGGLTSRAALALHPGWDVELGGGGDLVRYEPDDWQVLDREGVNAYGALTRHGASGFGRLSLMASRSRFSQYVDVRRLDTRLGAGADWSLEGAVVFRLSVGVAWNDSRLPAYDYRSGRAAVVFAAPWRGGSIQAYGALAHRNYLNPGPEDARVAPSDQDTGSIVVLQLTRPVSAAHTVSLRAEWSRSETGFRNDFYQRFGISAQLSLRGLGGL